ncbi:hypothetical protein Peur_026383 [Populus x canadensis]
MATVIFTTSSRCWQDNIRMDTVDDTCYRQHAHCFLGRILRQSLISEKISVLANKTTANMVVERESSSPGGESGKTAACIFAIPKDFDHVQSQIVPLREGSCIKRRTKRMSFILKSSPRGRNALLSYRRKERVILIETD